MLLLTFDIARTGAGVKPTTTSIFPSSGGCKLATFSEVFLFPQVRLRPFSHAACLAIRRRAVNCDASVALKSACVAYSCLSSKWLA